MGVTTVTCSATDAHGNTGSASFTVTVTDTTAPVVTPPADVTVEATSPSGAVATFADATALDIVDGPLPATCDHASGDTFPVGVTTVTCSATDAHGNTGTATFVVTVTDTTAPVVTPAGGCDGGGDRARAGAVATFADATALDIVDGPLPAGCDHASGDTFPVGVTTVTCSATDAHGNTGSATFIVTVTDTTAPVVTPPADVDGGGDERRGCGGDVRGRDRAPTSSTVRCRRRVTTLRVTRSRWVRRR